MGLVLKFAFLLIILFTVTPLCHAQDGPTPSPPAAARAVALSPGIDDHVCPELATNIAGNLSFSKESEWQQIKLCIYNPERCHIDFCTIKLIIPDEWNLKVNLDPDSPLYYDSNEKMFWVRDFGDFREDFMYDWFFIKPCSSAGAGDYNLGIEFDITYSYQFRNVVRTINDEHLVGFRNITLTMEQEDDEFGWAEGLYLILYFVLAVCAVLTVVLTYIKYFRYDANRNK